MNLKKLKEIPKAGKKVLIQHGPEISIAFGTGGMMFSTVLGILQTPEAMRLIEEKKKELGVENLSKSEVAKAVWKCYLPVAGMSIGSAALILLGTKVHMKRNAILATAYTLSEANRKEYREKVIETFGPKKEETVRDAMDKQEIKDHPVDEIGVEITGDGNTLIYDKVTKRYFRSDIDFIRKQETAFNKRLPIEMYMNINEFYHMIHIPPVPYGEYFGCTADNVWLDITTGSQKVTESMACITIDYDIEPLMDYRTLM